MATHQPGAPGLFQSITGRAGADLSGAADGDLRGQLLAAFGPSRRDDTRPDTRAAAKGLGVSQRTVERWLADPARQHYRPRAATQKKIATRSRQASTTKRGRERAVRQAQKAQKGTVGTGATMRVSLTGDQGPEAAYARFRSTNFDLDDPRLSQGFVQAYIDGGDRGAIAYLRNNADEAYGMDRWYFGDMTQVEAQGPYGR
ncbi:MAG: hypothetical protein AAGC63_06215 [Propionicimonas sp.]